MKKIFVISVLLITSVLLFTTVARAEGGNPWNTVWAAIQDLQNQITNIQLLPGPSGPTGATGPIGPQGPAGQQGSAGPGVNKDLMYVATSAETFIYPRGGLYTFVTVRCHDNNDPLFSGGYHLNPDPSNNTHILSSAGSPTDGTAGWTVGAYSDAPNDLSPGSIFVEAYCLRVD